MTHLPLYRQENILKRMQVDIGRGTLSNWVIKAGKQMSALANLIHDHTLEGPVVNIDETRIQVLKEKGRAATSKSQIWVMARGSPGRRSVYFHYDPSRSAKVVLSLLDGYQGYVVSDDYSAYNAANKKLLFTHCGCADHARRKFHDAYLASGKNTNSLAAYALNLFQSLYKVESQYGNIGQTALLRARQLYSESIMRFFRKWLDRVIDTVPPKSHTGIALWYLKRNWEKLKVFLRDAQIPISNQLVENALRPFTVGRRVWLFADTVAGADASAAIDSIIETAKLNDWDPYRKRSAKPMFRV